jgi:hypothetical protein
MERMTMDRVIVRKTAVGGQHVPRIINVKVGQSEPKCVVSPSHSSGWQMLSHKLTLRKDRHVLRELCFGVWRFVRIDLATDFADIPEILRSHAANTVFVGVIDHHFLRQPLNGTTADGANTAFMTKGRLRIFSECRTR